MRHHFTRLTFGTFLLMVACLAISVTGAARRRPGVAARRSIRSEGACGLGRRHRVGRVLEAARLRPGTQGRPGGPGRMRDAARGLPEVAGDAEREAGRRPRSAHDRGRAGSAGLAALLADDRTSDLAVYVLQAIPGPAADKALVQALASAKISVATRTAIIATLGERGSVEAAPALASMLKRPEFATAAATALGTIDDDRAVQALTGEFPGAAGDLKPVVAASLLRCAERSLAAKNPAAALASTTRSRRTPHWASRSAGPSRWGGSRPRAAEPRASCLATSRVRMKPCRKPRSSRSATSWRQRPSRPCARGCRTCPRRRR